MELSEAILSAARYVPQFLGADQVRLLDDAVQDARIYAWRVWKQKPTIGPRELRQVVYHSVCKTIRKARLRTADVHRVRRKRQIRPEEGIEYNERLTTLTQRIGPRRTRAIRMRAEGYSADDIGQELQCSSRAVFRMVAKAREQIQRGREEHARDRVQPMLG